MAVYATDNQAENGVNIMKKRILPILLICVLLIQPIYAASSNQFRDVRSSHWAYEAITQMANDGILSGFPDGTFRPDQAMTRAEFAVVLSNIADLQSADISNPYVDLNNHWAKKYALAISPYVNSLSDSEFGIDSYITREVALSAIIKVQYIVETTEVDINPVKTFVDFNAIDSELLPYVACALELGVTSGFPDGTFRPTASMTRAEACTMLYKAFYYQVDTVATNLYNFRTMVMDNDNNIYYIDGSTIYNTATDYTLDLSYDFETPLTNPYLAYDPYNDIVYLLAGGMLTIYDITDFNNPISVLNTNNCAALTKGTSGGKLAYTSDVTPQIAILENGSLLVPFDSEGTWLVNPTLKTVTKTNNLYFRYAKVLGNQIIYFKAKSTEAFITAIGSDVDELIELEVEAPYNNGNTLCSKYGYVYFYLDSVGVCLYDASGCAYNLIPQEKIIIKDYQSLDYTNIWDIDIGDENHIAFYDNSLKCIRLIQPIQ